MTIQQVMDLWKKLLAEVFAARNGTAIRPSDFSLGGEEFVQQFFPTEVMDGMGWEGVIF